MKIGSVLGSPRGNRNLFRRTASIFRRFGVTPHKMEAMLNRYVEITREFGCGPTFPITAVTLKRHPNLIKALHERGAEFAIHGYIHVDHKPLSVEEQHAYFKKAVDIFRKCDIPFTGFRAPYLRSNTSTLAALKRLGIAYDSSWVVHWDVVDKTMFEGKAWQDYSSLLDFYSAQKSDSCLVLPIYRNGMLVIPVSIPDDEAMVGRLGIRDKAEIARIWQTVFRQTHSRGDLFTVQLHHERVPYCETALRTLLQETKSCDPPVWIATLGEIAEWWEEKQAFTFDISPLRAGSWSVKVHCTDRATVLVRRCTTDQPYVDWADDYRCVEAREFVVECLGRPCVGVAPGTAQEAISFLESEGYLVEATTRPQDYSLYFDHLAAFDESGRKRLSETIESSDASLVRFWRWPHGARSALSITGDVDSITLIDFFMRVFEVWRQRLASRNHM